MTWRPVLISTVAILAACSTSQSTEAPTEQAVARPAESGDEPRLVIEPLVPQEQLPAGTDVHYDFAHFILPLVVFSSPREVVREQFLGPTADRFVKMQWAVLHEKPPASSPKARRVRLEVGEATLITMPPPERNAQAYFTLILFKDNGPIRYMTLERSVFMRDDDPRRTVVGEWTIEDGSPVHGNFGEGPPPDEQAFLDAVIEYVR